MTQRLRIVLGGKGEICFQRDEYGRHSRDVRGWTVAELFSGALEHFLAGCLPGGRVVIESGVLSVNGLPQSEALAAFERCEWRRVFHEVGAAYANCAGRLSPLEAFFDVAWDAGAASRADLSPACFAIYELFSVCECFLLDMAVEAFLEGARRSPARPDVSLLDKVAAAPPAAIPQGKTSHPVPHTLRASRVDLAPAPQLDPQDPFQYPAWACGWHSGWDDPSRDPCSSLALTARREVSLAPFSVNRTIALNGVAAPSFLMKTPEGRIRGLSSGAGGSLVPWTSGVLKFKRCGLGYTGIVLDAIRDRSVRARDGDLIETSVAIAAGLAPLDTLEREVQVSARLPEFGFEAASKPVAIHEVIRGKPGSGCLVSEVKSDLRVDEVLCALCLNAGRLLSISERLELAEELGSAEGSLYGAVHRRRMIRGIGNSWFGNEALAPDGRLLLCDLENLFFPDCAPENLAGFYARHEVNIFNMAVWRSALAGSPALDPIATPSIGRLFLAAFKKAYHNGGCEPRRACAAAEYVKAAAAEAVHARSAVAGGCA